jgi:hypothetical protein
MTAPGMVIFWIERLPIVRENLVLPISLRAFDFPFCFFGAARRNRRAGPQSQFAAATTPV